MVLLKKLLACYRAAGLVQVIVYTSPDDRKKNRGFCFLDYENHRLATIAKRKFSTGRIRIWNCDIIVDWADPLEEPDEEVMSKVTWQRPLFTNSEEARLLFYDHSWQFSTSCLF
jgi:glycogen synthase